MSLLNRINFRFNLRDLTFFFMVARTQKVAGITSKVGKDEHIILWDLDRCNFTDAVKSLVYVQDKYKLGDILIISDKENSYGGICLTKVTFNELLKILIDTPLIDMGFVAYTAKRYGATLRLSSKKDRKDREVIDTIKSPFGGYRETNNSDFHIVVYDTGLVKNGLHIGEFND